MKLIDSILKKTDGIQQKSKVIGFTHAVIKKYSEDDAGYQAALITYYGFLSLFPLLLVMVSLLDKFAQGNDAFRAKVIEGLGGYLPLIGPQLEQNIHVSDKSGIALFIGIIFTIYGARGVADAFRYALNTIWRIPKSKRPGFPKAQLRSIALIVVGGTGLIVTAILAGFATSLGHLFIFKILSVVLSLCLLILIFSFLFRVGGSGVPSNKDVLLASAISSIGIVILQGFGGYLITNQLKNLNDLYGTFAIVLGLLFWIYLQVQVVMYAVEISIVHRYNLYPRSLTGKNLTKADEAVKHL